VHSSCCSRVSCVYVFDIRLYVQLAAELGLMAIVAVLWLCFALVNARQLSTETKNGVYNHSRKPAVFMQISGIAILMSK